MENVKEIIAKNLVELRKANKMTQSTLAEKLNYSDKAISRWEHAETLPDIETLCKVCDIYGVTFEYLLQEEQPATKNPYIKKGNLGQQIIFCLIGIFTVWLIATVLFASVNVLWHVFVWQIFIWALPVTGAVGVTCNKIWWKSKIWSILLSSFNNWTTILALYLQFVSYNLWMLFLIGIPIQALIILSTTQSKKIKQMLTEK